jgi:hypothetical protein
MGNPRTDKKKRNMENSLWKRTAKGMLTDEVSDTLAGIDHPKIKSYEESMLSYVYWLIEHNYTYKAIETINAYT